MHSLNGWPHAPPPSAPAHQLDHHIALKIVACAIGLADGGFSYTKNFTAMKVGAMELTVKDKKTFNGLGA